MRPRVRQASPRLRMTDQQKRDRRYARENGTKAVRAIQQATLPTCDDEELWTGLAVSYTIAAHRYWRRGEGEGR